jgi:hypothetical protein
MLAGNGEVDEKEFRFALESVSAPSMKCDLRAVQQRMSALHK